MTQTFTKPTDQRIILQGRIRASPNFVEIMLLKSSFSEAFKLKFLLDFLEKFSLFYS